MTIQKIAFWTPRVLGILYALFLSIFALDVFSEGYNVAETVLALGMHLIPTAVVAVVLLVAWKSERIGGLLFMLVGAAFWVFFGGRNDWIGSLIISGPLILIGALFLIWGYMEGRSGG
jgi:hypothetical protein